MKILYTFVTLLLIIVGCLACQNQENNHAIITQDKPLTLEEKRSKDLAEKTCECTAEMVALISQQENITVEKAGELMGKIEAASIRTEECMKKVEKEFAKEIAQGDEIQKMKYMNKYCPNYSKMMEDMGSR